MTVRETAAPYLFHIEGVTPQNLALGLVAYINQVDPKRVDSVQRTLQTLLEQDDEISPVIATGRVPSVRKEVLLKYGIHSKGAWLNGEFRALSEATKESILLWDKLASNL